MLFRISYKNGESKVVKFENIKSPSILECVRKITQLRRPVATSSQGTRIELVYG